VVGTARGGGRPPGAYPDAPTHELLEEILSYPGVPSSLRTDDLVTPIVPVVPVSFEKNGRRYDFFSTVTTLGTPRDVTVQELRIECFFPADGETERAVRHGAAW